MAPNATEQVAQWFESDEMRPNLVLIVQAWNSLELLGIDLADQLRSLVARKATRADVDVLDQVDWNLLAERYAEEIAGVDEDELTRRREQYTN